MKSKVQPRLLRMLNERRILEAIQTRGPSSRADLVRYSGISAPTVSKAVASLLKMGLLEEGDEPGPMVGRPATVYKLASTSVQVLGAVVGTKRCWLVSTGLDGQMLEDQMLQFATPGSYKSLVDTFADRAKRLIQEKETPALGLGISMPGLFNHRMQKTVFSPNLHQTDGRSLGSDLQKRLGIETVTLQECDALCLAEQAFGSAKGMNDFAMLDITEGLGLGVVSGGRLLDGHSGLAGEIGHITVDPRGQLCGCGNHGCLETVATDAALAKAISEKRGTALDIEEVVELVQSGEIQPAEELNKTLEFLAIGVAAVINIFNPAALFVYGRFLDAQEGLFSQLLELVRRRALAPSLADCQIIRARGSKRQGAIAGIIKHLTSAHGPTLAS